MNNVEKARAAERQKAKETYGTDDLLASAASMLVMSHLSDADMIKSADPKQASIHMNFAKFIISRLGGDLTYVVDADKLWAEFHEQFNHLFD